jgi:tetratricopeptide (TPR) repeat protein
MSYARANYQMFLRRQAFLRQKFNRHTFIIVGNLSLLGSILASFFLVQEFPNPSHSILSDRPTFKEPEISPRENASIYNQPGYIRSAQGDVLGAIADFDRSIKLNPILAKTYYNQRLANDNLEYEQSVKQDWNRALSLNSQELENDDNSFKSDKNKKFDQLAVLSSPLIDTIESPSALSSSLSSEIESISIPLKVPKKDMSFLPKPKRLTIPEDFPQKSDQLAHRSIFIRPPNKIINKPPLDTLMNPSVLGKKIQTDTSRKTEADGINNQQVNLNLALSFYQQGIFYKNLGINSEAIRNLEEASLLLQKYGQKNGNQDIAKEVETIIRNLRKENSSS